MRRHTLSETPSKDDLGNVALELREVRAALRCGGQYLGMSGSILQEYLADVARKDNLLRLSLTRVGCTARPRAFTSEFVKDECLETYSSSDLAPSSPLTVGKATEGLAFADSFSKADSCARSPTLQPVTADATVTSSRVASSSGRLEDCLPCESSLIAPHCTKLACLEDVDCSSLVAVLNFLDMHQQEARAQRFGIHAVGRLARDEVQLRPLCLAAVLAVSRAVFAFPADLTVQRVSVAALSSLVYKPEVAILVAHEALPAITAAMVAYAHDTRLQDVACEALARLVQAGESLVVKAVVQAALWRDEPGVVEACCQALARLRSSGVFQPGHILDTLLPLTESQPSHLMIQYRASALLRGLVRASAIDEAAAAQRAAPLLSAQWANLLARFEGAAREEAAETQRFHADVQALFHEEVGKHFEYESAERSLHLLRRREPPMQRLKEVVRCLVENLEDYQSRLQARELAWDAEEQSLVPLSACLCEKLSAEAVGCMEMGLVDAFRDAASAEGSHGESTLSRRTAIFRAECAALLDKKTEATQSHHERMEDLRREVMLFEAVEYLELHSKDASATQIRTARYMLSAAEEVAPPEALVRLRSRLEFIATSRSLLVPAA